MIWYSDLDNKTVLLFVSFITGSYDRTCKIWDTASEEELHTLEGHRNVVYAIAYNNPFGFVSSAYVAPHITVGLLWPL